MAGLAAYLASMVAKPSNAPVVSAQEEALTKETKPPRFAPAGRVQFGDWGMPRYNNCFAVVLDNLFSNEELSHILAAAEASSEWEVARVNATADISYVMADYRNGERIILDDEELSATIFTKIRPHLGEIETFMDDEWTRDGRKYVKKRMVKMNERLRFLRYKEGGFFRKHCDGTYITPDGLQRTYYTVQLYLPSSSDGSLASFQAAQGGSTRFLVSGKPEAYVDVEAIPGRVLVFQHDGLLHTGEEVTSGVKCTVRSDILYESVNQQ